MKILRRFNDLINTDSPVNADPNEPVELALVPGLNGPMIVARLQEDGFNTTGYETSNGIGLPNEYRILVPRAELPRATSALDHLL